MIALRFGLISRRCFCIASSWDSSFVLMEKPSARSATPWMSESYFSIVVRPLYLAASVQSSSHVVGRSVMRSFR